MKSFREQSVQADQENKKIVASDLLEVPVKKQNKLMVVGNSMEDDSIFIGQNEVGTQI